MKFLIVVLSSLLPSLSIATSNATLESACVIAFYDSDLAGRKRAQKVLAEKQKHFMTPEIAYQAMENQAVVTIGSFHNPGNAQIGVIRKVRPRSFDLLNRWGSVARIPFRKPNQYFHIESEQARVQRLLWVKRQASDEAQTLVESALWAQGRRLTVEVQFTATHGHRQYRQTFRGRVQFVDVREVWDKGLHGLMKRRDQIVVWIEHPQLETERLSKSGHVLETKPTPTISLPVSFDLTGPEAIKLNQFAILL